MATAFKFDLVTPERVLMSADVEQVLVPGADGDLTVLAGHAPLISTLRSGFIEAKGTDNKTTRIFVRGGFCEISPENVSILAERASDAAAMGSEAIAAELKIAEADLASAANDEARWMAQTAITELKTLGSKAA